jgi:hypothetical protein
MSVRDEQSGGVSSPSCDGAHLDVSSGRSAILELRRQFESGGFYKSVASRFGAPKACLAKSDNGALELRYRFSKDTNLSARFDPSIAYADHVLEVSGGFTWKEAEEYLRRDEQDQFGTAGCGIAWAQPTESMHLENGARRDRYRGDTCNCQAYVESTLQGIKLIGFRSTC